MAVPPGLQAKEENTEEGSHGDAGTDLDGDYVDDDPTGPVHDLAPAVTQPTLNADDLLEWALLPLKAQRKKVREALPRGFYVSLDRVTNCRRLHSLKCYRTPTVDFSPWEYAGLREPAEDAYHVVCRTCFRLSVGEERARDEDDALASDEDFTSDESCDGAAEEFWGPTAQYAHPS